MGHTDMLSGRQMDKARYFSKKMSGVRVTDFPLTPVHSCFKFVIAWYSYYVLLES